MINNSCPKCGYCPTCGRSNNPFGGNTLNTWWLGAPGWTNTTGISAGITSSTITESVIANHDAGDHKNHSFIQPECEEHKK